METLAEYIDYIHGIEYNVFHVYMDRLSIHKVFLHELLEMLIDMVDDVGDDSYLDLIDMIHSIISD